MSRVTQRVRCGRVLAMVVIGAAGMSRGNTDTEIERHAVVAPTAATAPSSSRTLTPLTTAQAQQLRIIATRLKAVGARCVAFEQTRHMVGLQHPLIFSGEFSLGTNGSIDWRLQRPLAVEYLFARSGAWRRTSPQSPWVTLGLPGAASAVTAQVFAALIDLDPDALQRYFTLGYSNAPQSASDPHDVGPPLRLQAVPKDARLRAVVAWALVEVGRYVERVEIHEAAGDWSQYKLAEPRTAVGGASNALGAASNSSGTSIGAGVSAGIARTDCPPMPAAP